MGNKILGTDIAGIVNEVLGPVLLSGTLVKKTTGTRTAGALTAGTNPTSTTYRFRGIYEPLATKYVDDTIIRATDSAVLILGDSLPSGIVPVSSDTITLEGRTTTVVALLERDPDAASYLYAVRG